MNNLKICHDILIGDIIEKTEDKIHDLILTKKTPGFANKVSLNQVTRSVSMELGLNRADRYEVLIEQDEAEEPIAANKDLFQKTVKTYQRMPQLDSTLKATTNQQSMMNIPPSLSN